MKKQLGYIILKELNQKCGIWFGSIRYNLFFRWRNNRALMALQQFIRETARSKTLSRFTRQFSPDNVREQSNGESAFAYFTQKIGEGQLYLLDEPETALSPRGVLALLYRIHELSADSQFIIATHSPILMACPGAQILEFSADGIRETDYQQTEHYRLTRQFLDAPERMLSYLLEQP